MRDKRFVAVHRGGPLILEHHRLLMSWACVCADHVLPLLGEAGLDERLLQALETARDWEHGNASVGDARKASVGAIQVAREIVSNPSAVAVARAIGHTVATAHMADHSLGTAWYGLRAVKAAGQSVDLERTWQDEQVPAGIKELVLSAREDKRFRV
jgi:hypothetical protein